MNVNLKQFALTKNVLADAHLKELLKGSSISFFFKIAGILIGYLLTLVIAKKYGPDILGIYSLSITVLGIIAWISRVGLDSGIIKFVASYSSENREDLIWDVYKKSFKLVIFTGILFSFLLFLSSPFFSQSFFHKANLADHFRIASLGIVPMSLVMLNSAAFRGRKKIAESSFFSNLADFLSLLLLVSFSLFTAEGKVPLLAFLVGTILTAFLSQYFWSKKTKLATMDLEKTEGLKIKDILRVSIPMLFAGSTMLILMWTDTVMLGIFGNERDVGIFNVAIKMATVPSIALFCVNSIAAPKFAELYAVGKIEELGAVVRKSTKLIFWSALPLTVVLFVFPSFLLGIFGEDFKAGKYALLLLLVGNLISSISGSVAYILIMTGKQNTLQIILLFGTILNVSLNAVLIPAYGINGAAFASMLSLSFWNLAAVLYIKRHFSFTTIYLPFIKRT